MPNGNNIVVSFKIQNPAILQWTEAALKTAVRKGAITPQQFSQLPQGQLNGLSADFYTALPPRYFTDELSVPAHVIAEGGHMVPVSAAHALAIGEAMARSVGETLSPNARLRTQLEHLLQPGHPMDRLKALVEFPCWPILSRIVHRGDVPVYSNAFGSGPKGVFWRSVENLRRGFTPLNPESTLLSVPLHGPKGLIDYPVVPLKQFSMASIT